MSTLKKKNNLEISWLGMDGFLVAMYFVVVGIILWTILAKNDLMMGTIIPFGLMIGVTLIFFNYISHVFKFAKPKNQKGIPEASSGEPIQNQEE
ncbi:hypothetical protein [Clostridium aminobutyricum]|uniref:hypothetical protein n=1 Tax=Clostridium aminobutyricum TaxID=33953 RepID=UPI001FD6D4D0|nr:hypothetical protein [Clostridium aminobutyricum]